MPNLQKQNPTTFVNQDLNNWNPKLIALDFREKRNKSSGMVSLCLSHWLAPLRDFGNHPASFPFFTDRLAESEVHGASHWVRVFARDLLVNNVNNPYL